MSFIQVTDFRLDAERAEQPPPANPKHNLLFQPQLRSAPIKLAGNAAVSREVRKVIAVEQVKMHPANLDLPGTQADRVTRQVKLQPQPLPVRLAQGRYGQLPGIVVREKGLLRSVLVEHLPKIALLVEQTHADDRNS